MVLSRKLQRRQTKNPEYRRTGSRMFAVSAGPTSMLRSGASKEPTRLIGYGFSCHLGILPAGIISLIVQVKHTLSLPLCSRCNQRRSLAPVVSWLSIIACIFLLFPTIGFAIGNKSWLVFLGGSGLIATIAYLAGRYDRSVNPRYIQFTKERVEIEVPG